MSGIRSRLLGAIKVVMRAQDKPRLTMLRLALTDIKRVRVDERTEVDDARTPLILNRMIKQHHDTQRQFSDAGRQDLTEIRTTEILVLQDLIPKPLDDHEINALIEYSIVNSGTQGPRGVSKTVNLLRPQVQGRVDMAQVSQYLKVCPSPWNTTPT